MDLKPIGDSITHATDLLFQAATGLATIIGDTAQHVYIVLVRQQMLEGGVALMVWGAGIWFVVWFTKYIGSIVKKTDNTDNLDYILSILGAFFLAIWFVVSAMGAVQLALLRLINPEYYALIQIMGVLQNVTR